MATVSYSAIASQLLSDLGAPDNALTNAAVVTWLKHESGSSIIGNNPWNIHYDVALSYGIQPSGKWYSSSDQAYVAQFATWQDGVQATATILNKNIHGYRQAADALRANNPVGFLNAIAASDWSSSHYGATVNTSTHTITGGVNALLGEYTKLSGGGATTVSTGNSGSTTTTLPPNTLASFLGHDGTLTLADLPAIVAAIEQTDYFKKNQSGGLLAFGAPGTELSPHAYLVDFVGHKYSDIPLNLGDTTQNLDMTGPSASQQPFYQTDLLAILEWLVDPAHWLAIVALGIGVVMTGYGIVVLVRSYGGNETIAIMQPTERNG